MAGSKQGVEVERKRFRYRRLEGGEGDARQRSSGAPSSQVSSPLILSSLQIDDQPPSPSSATRHLCLITSPLALALHSPRIIYPLHLLTNQSDSNNELCRGS